MKNKFKMMLLCTLCVICLQVSLTAYAFDTATDHDFELPLDSLPESEVTSVPAAESFAEQSSKATDKITSDSSNPTAASSKTTNKSDTEEKSVSSGKAESSSESIKTDESSVIHSDSDYIELPVITTDGELVETSKTTSAADNELSQVSEISSAPESSDSSLSSENSSVSENSVNSLSDESDNSRIQAESHTDSSESGSSNFPIIIAGICGAVIIAVGIVFVVIRKVRK